MIFGDYAGFDTFSSMERAIKIFDIKDAIIVSQGFHLPRSVYIAQFKGMDAIGYSTKASYGKRSILFVSGQQQSSQFLIVLQTAKQNSTEIK